MHWGRVLPADLTGGGPHEATDQLRRQAVAMVLYGHTIEYYLAAPIERAKRRLLPAAEQAARQDVPKTGIERSLKLWKRAETANLQQSTLILLRTSLTAVDRMAGRWLIPDDQLDQDQDSPYGG
jgi:hypothetical protein